MAINETKIIVKAVDEATPVFSKIGAGAKGVGTAMDEVSRKAGGLTNYIKEQRKEGRQHSFVIGEMKDTLAVAGLAMNMVGESAGKGNEQFKKINDSVNKGIIAFMGLDAVVSGLSKVFKSFGGWVGMAITVIGAITFGLLDFMKTSEDVSESLEKETNAHDRINERLRESKRLYNDLDTIKKRQTMEDRIAIAVNIININNEIEVQNKKLKTLTDYVGKNDKLVEAQQGQIEITKRIIEGLQKELAVNEKSLEKIKQAEKFTQDFIAVKEKEKKVIETVEQAKKGVGTGWEKTNLDRSFNALLANNKLRIKGDFDTNTTLKLGRTELTDFEISEARRAWEEKNELQKKEKENVGRAMQQMSQAVDIFQGFSNNAFEERMNNYDRELDKLNQFYSSSAEKINADYNARIAAAQGNAELEVALEAEKAAKLQKLEEEKAAAQLIIEDKIKAEKRKNFIANQNAAIIQAVIDTASAVVEALPNPFAVAWAGAMGLAQIALIKSQPIPNFHTGGGMFFNAPANQETPVMVRGQETIRVTTPQQERNRNGGGITINFNSPVSDVEFVKNSIKKVLKNTGLKVENAFVNNRNKLSFA